jgi:predicted RND superfamily exporter protein
VSRSISPRARRFVAFTLRHRFVLWALALALAIPATARTAGLYARLQTGIEELLPRDAPSVRAIDELRHRLRGIQHLGVLVDVGDAKNLPAGERLLDDLAGRIRAYPKELVRSVRVGQGEERAFLDQHAPLYLDVADLRTIRERIEARRDFEVEKATGTLFDEEAEPPPLAFDDLRAKYESKTDGADRFPNGRFSSAKERATLLLVEVGEFSTGGNAASLLHRVQSDVAALGGPDAYALGMRVGYTGDVATSVEETSALMEDLSFSSVVVTLAVLAVLVAYYRWAYSLAIVLPPLVLATVYAFGAASLPFVGVTALNANTAFLGSIIVGNGINFGIVLLARYVEERRRGVEVEDALAIAVSGARAGTLVASLAAGAAYASLCLTDFRGFRQFGIIGGLGMVFSWGSAFLLTPSLVFWIDRGKRSPRRAGPSAEPWLMGRVARLVTRHPLPVALVAASLVVAAAAKVSTFGADQIEYDLSRLRRADTWTNGEGYWGRKMDAVLGKYLTPTVILADDEAEAQKIARAVRDATTREPLRSMVADVRTLEDVLPPDQPVKLVEIEAIRKVLTPKIRSLLPDDQRKAVERMVAHGPARAIGVDDLPSSFTLGMRERDGAIGRTVLVYPRPSKALWVGPTIGAFVEAIRAAAVADGARGRVAGSLPLSADIFEALGRDGPLATALALSGVTLLVVAVFRGGWVGVTVLGSLLVGVLWLAALAMTLGVKLNFANFIAYPITFGIGVDYAVNVMSRFVQDGADDVGGAVRSTGGAVGLCALTTILGYSSLLFAQNRALHLFGLMAVLGEIACLTTAVVVLPSVLGVVRAARRAPRGAAPPVS